MQEAKDIMKVVHAYVQVGICLLIHLFLLYLITRIIDINNSDETFSVTYISCSIWVVIDFTIDITWVVCNTVDISKENELVKKHISKRVVESSYSRIIQMAFRVDN